MTYIWQHPEWYKFRYDTTILLPSLGNARYNQGRLIGLLTHLGFDAKRDIELESATEEAVKTSKIEGEYFDFDSVRSSIAYNLGMHDIAYPPTNRHIEGLTELVLDARRNYMNPLSCDRLFGWHSLLFPTGRSGSKLISVAKWRLGEIEVVSGAYDRIKVHYEGPPSDQVPIEMDRFLEWFEYGSLELDGLVKSAIAHLWFLTIHPFDDGNGRIGRAIIDLSISRTEQTDKKFYSISQQIEKDKKNYYEIINKAQHGTSDQNQDLITEYILWFIDCYNKTIKHAEIIINKTIHKTKFWNNFSPDSFSKTQIKVIKKILQGFEGHITIKKWQKLCTCSYDEAINDIGTLIERGIIKANVSNKNTITYTLAREP